MYLILSKGTASFRAQTLNMIYLSRPHHHSQSRNIKIKKTKQQKKRIQNRKTYFD